MMRALRLVRGPFAATLLLAATPAGVEAQMPAVPAWTDPSPHQVRRVAVAPDVELEVLDWGGSGPALVFLAGLGNSAHVYDNFAPRFRDRFHVYAITRRGYGVSSHPAGGYDAVTRANDIVTVLDSLHADRAVLAGHSIAGDELSKVGATYPGRVRALVYHDAYDYGPARVAAQGRGRALFSLMSATNMTAADSASPAAVMAFMRRTFPHRGAEPESEIRQMVIFGPDGRLTRDVAGEGVGGLVIAGTEASEFARITAPALGVFAVYSGPGALLSSYATLDSAGRAQADLGFGGLSEWGKGGRDRFRSEMRDGTVIELTDAKHYVFLTEPDRVEREMRTFLTRRR